MTLPELLIAITIAGVLVAVISAALVVTLRQQPLTEQRLDLSRAEQSLSMWLPNDLASADSFTEEPWASPCGAPQCGSVDLSNGSNVLMLEWSIESPTADGTVSHATRVSYHFRPAGDAYELLRVVCTAPGSGWDCTSQVLLGNLPGPPAGSTFHPGVPNGTQCLQSGTGSVECTQPTWVIEVSVPLRPDATEDGPDAYATGDLLKDANRVMVTLSDGGVGGASGGATKVSITAGGTNRTEIAADSLIGAPSFVEARSRCGGPLTLIVDQSSSISMEGASAAVRDAVRSFTETLAGTPVQLQVVDFADRAAVLGTSGWSRYFDMRDVDGDVAELLGLVNGLSPSGYTNWEDALFRTFYNQDGTISDTYPETVVFFTDGMPTVDRQMGSTHKTGGDLAGQPVYPRPPWADKSTSYNQASFNRAGYIAAQHRARVRMVGVGVGGINDDIQWVASPGSGFAFEWQRGSGRYYKAQEAYQTNRRDFRVGTAFSSNLDYERRSGSSWTDISPDVYFANNTSSTHSGSSAENDGYRIRQSGSGWRTRSGNNSPMGFDSARRYVEEIGSYNTNNFRVTAWGASSAAEYKAASAAERQRLYQYSTTSWTVISQAEYEAGNIDGTQSDGFRVSGSTYTWLTEADYQAGLAAPEPDTTYHSVSKRWVGSSGTPALTEAEAPDWETVPSPYSTVQQQINNENNSSDGYRATRTYPASAPPGGYAGYTPAVTSTKSGAQALANLVAGDDVGIPYVSNPDNAKIANMYVLPPANQGGFNQLKDALRSVALGQCGGTLTVRTQLANGSTVRDPFTYQRSTAWDALGNPVAIEASVATTNQQYPTGTFDFDFPSGTGIRVEVLTQNYAELSRYQPVGTGWSCRAGITQLVEGQDYELVPIRDENGDATGWYSIRVDVSANQAVSCTQTVQAS